MLENIVVVGIPVVDELKEVNEAMDQQVAFWSLHQSTTMSIITVASCLRKILSDEDIFMRCKSNQCRKTMLQIVVTTANKQSSNCNQIGSYCPFINK